MLPCGGMENYPGYYYPEKKQKQNGGCTKVLSYTQI